MVNKCVINKNNFQGDWQLKIAYKKFLEFLNPVTSGTLDMLIGSFEMTWIKTTFNKEFNSQKIIKELPRIGTIARIFDVS